MNTKQTRLWAAVLGAVALSSSMALASQGFLFSNLRGTLHLVQDVPCGAVVDATTTIADGRMEITQSSLRGDAIGTQFDLSLLDVFFTPFAVKHECLGVAASAEFSEIGVRLARSVRFTGQPIGDGVYRFVIPKSQVLLYESVHNNLPVRQPETLYTLPSEDVTGQIDLRSRTAQLRFVLSSKLTFRVGCVDGHCVIDETLKGTQTADVTGKVVSPGTDTDHDGVGDLSDNCPLEPNRTQTPVATPVLRAPADVTFNSCQTPNLGTATARDVCHARPVLVTNNAPAHFALGQNIVTWSAADGIDPVVTARQVVTIVPAVPVVACRSTKPQVFQVVAAESCGGPTTLKLGSFSLGNGEVVQIEQTGKPGVRLINTVGNDKMKHFQVGKGEALIVATDASGNVGQAACGPLQTEITTEVSSKKK